MRQDSAPQLAILFDGTRAHAVYTCQQSQFLADRLVASAGKPFPRCAGQLVAKAKGKRRAAARGTQGPVENNRAGQGLRYIRTRMLTPLIDGLGRATWSLTMLVTRSRTPSF